MGGLPLLVVVVVVLVPFMIPVILLDPDKREVIIVSVSIVFTRHSWAQITKKVTAPDCLLLTVALKVIVNCCNL